MHETTLGYTRRGRSRSSRQTPLPRSARAAPAAGSVPGGGRRPEGARAQARRAVRQGRRQASERRRAQGRRARCSSRSRRDAAAAAAVAAGRGGMAGTAAAPKLDAGRRQARRRARCRSTTSGTLRTLFLEFENERLGSRADGVQQHRRRGAGDADRRRQDLQGRRRPLPRRVVVLRRAGGAEALAQRRARLRRTRSRALLGYKTLNLLNSHDDPTLPAHGALLADRARATCRRRRRTSCASSINGESWGVYVSAQQFNKDFVNEWFKTTDGARWKVPGSPGGRGGLEYLGDDVAAYKRIYEIKSKDDPKAWAALDQPDARC